MSKNNAFAVLAAAILFSAPAIAQKQVPPEGGKPKEFRLPKKESFKLPNGMGVTLVPYGTVPKASVEIAVRMGNLNEGPDEVWLADLLGDMMKEGTTTRSAQDISREAALMGGSVGVSVGPDQTTFSGDVLSESAPDMISLLADIVRNPKLPESELPRLKNDKLRALHLAQADPQQMTNELFRKLMFPGHPYGRTLPTESMIQAYTTERLRSFHDANAGAARAHLYVVGRFERKSVSKAISTAFSSWKRGADPLVNIPNPVSARDIHIIDRPGAAQSTVYIGLPVIDPSNKEYMALKVTDALLGGSFASRITSNIREDKGYTYSPGSVISSRYRNAFWAEEADVTTDVTGPSIKEILYEITRLQSTPPPEEELRGIQNYLAGIFVLQNSSRFGIIGQLALINLHGLPEAYLSGYVKNVYGVTPSKVSEIAKTILRPDEMRIVIAGDKKKVEPQVSSFGKIIN